MVEDRHGFGISGLNADESRTGDVQGVNENGGTPPPSYQEATGQSFDMALHKQFMCQTRLTMTMEGLLNDYWVYGANRELLFRTHTLVFAKGTKVTHVGTNQEAFLMQYSKRKGKWRYSADLNHGTSEIPLFEIESHEKFIKGGVAHMSFYNDCSQKTENTEIHKDRENQKWQVFYKGQIVAAIDFPSTTSVWKIHIHGRGIDPSILIALTLVIIVGARKLEG